MASATTTKIIHTLFWVSCAAIARELSLSILHGPQMRLGYHDTLVAKQRGYHKQIPHSQNESLIILFHYFHSSTLAHHNLP